METLLAAIFIGFSAVIVVGLTWLAFLNWHEQRNGMTHVDDGASVSSFSGGQIKAVAASAPSTDGRS